MSQTLKQKNIISNIIYLTLSVCLIALALLAYHDLQTAQGAGLYLALLQNADNRVPYDLFMDAVGCLGLLVTTILPLIFLKKCNPGAYLRFLCLYLAFIPIINPGDIVHIGQRITNWTLQKDLSFLSLLYALNPFMTMMIALVPLLLVLLAFCAEGETLYCKKYRMILLFLSCVMTVMYVLFPGFGEYPTFLSYFFVILVVFDTAEELWMRSDKDRKLWLLYLLCGLKGIYHIIMLLQTTHI